MVQRSAATILNVNDTPESLYVATRSLELAGYRVVEAMTGAHALQQALAERPDVVVLDVKLPDMSGYDVCRQLKSDPRTRDSAIIHTSATYITAQKKVAGLRAGADVYLTQPFDPEELIATVSALVRLHRAEGAARARAEQLAEADRRKDEFLAMLAHELRNPLAAITTAAKLVEHQLVEAGGALAPAVARQQAIIQRQAQHLGRLVDDLLDVSRITHGKVELRPQRLELGGVLQSALAAVRPVASARGLALDVSLPAGPLWVQGDATRLEQVFANLLDNAVKYSDPGACISVQLAHEELQAASEDAQPAPGPGLARLRVADTGIGIPAHALGRVFELFSQVDQSLERTRGGLGIGLTLVRRLVQMHGGSVEVASAGAGQGSEFTVRLPLLAAPGNAAFEVAAAAAAAVASAGPSPRRAGARGRSVLLVEDNVDAGDAMQEMLEVWGHRVRVARDGLQGVALALQQAPDVALVDVGLPGLDGFQVAQRLRATFGDRLRLVALTGYGGSEQQRRALQAGFDVHLVKPVQMDALARVLDVP